MVCVRLWPSGGNHMGHSLLCRILFLEANYVNIFRTHSLRIVSLTSEEKITGYEAGFSGTVLGFSYSLQMMTHHSLLNSNYGWI